jgi:hypothetical protein
VKVLERLQNVKVAGRKDCISIYSPYIPQWQSEAIIPKDIIGIHISLSCDSDTPQAVWISYAARRALREPKIRCAFLGVGPIYNVSTTQPSPWKN